MRSCERIARCPIDFIPLAATTLLLRRLEPRKIRYRNSERQYLVSYGLLGNRKILEGIDDLRPDSSVIPDEKRGPVDSPAKLARTPLRQRCLRELSLLRRVLACARSLLLARRSAYVPARMAVGRLASWLEVDPLRTIRIASSNHRDCPSRQIMADSTSCGFSDIPAHVLHRGVLS